MYWHWNRGSTGDLSYIITTVYAMSYKHERISRNNKKLKELDKMAGIRCIIHSRKVMMIMSPYFILIQQIDTKAAQYYQSLP
jgi:hypothetical protein